MTLIGMKYQTLVSNAARLQKMIDDLQLELTDNKSLRTTTRIRLATCIANLMTTQAKLLSSVLTKQEIDILSRLYREGSIRQQTLLSQEELDFDETWDAIANLKRIGLIEVTGTSVQEKILSPVIDVN